MDNPTKRYIDSKAFDEINRALRILNHDIFILTLDFDDLRDCLGAYQESSLAQNLLEKVNND